MDVRGEVFWWLPGYWIILCSFFPTTSQLEVGQMKAFVTWFKMLLAF